MEVRLPDAPPIYEMSWGTSLVNALSQALQRLGQPQSLPRYTIAKLPNPAAYRGVLVYLADGLSGQRIAVSDGVAWRYPSGVLV